MESIALNENSPLSILLVEDDVHDEALIATTLQREGLAFIHSRVVDAEGLLEQLQRREWDLIISDYNLPVFSADEVLSILKAQGLDTPCIVISGYIGEEAAVSLMKSGAGDFVAKANLARLVPAIRREVAEASNRREKRKIAQNLLRHEKLLADITAALGEGLLVSDLEGNVIFVNPEAQRLLGWENVPFFGKNLGEVLKTYAEENRDAPQLFPDQRYIDLGLAYRSEDQLFVRQDGSSFPVSYVSTPIFEDGQVTAVVTAFQDISVRKLAEQELIASRRQLQELSSFLQNILEEERSRIARELHDELGQALTALKMDVIWMSSRFAADQDALLAKADHMVEQIGVTVDSVRRIAANLRPGLLDDLGLAAAIEWLLEEFQKRTGVCHELNMSHEEFDFDPELTTTIFRILQEAITNVARHAQASHLLVALEDQGNAVVLSIKDNGIGFKPSLVEGQHQSFGLLGIRERVTALGGDLSIVGELGEGTELGVTLPKRPIKISTMLPV